MQLEKPISTVRSATLDEARFDTSRRLRQVLRTLLRRSGVRCLFGGKSWQTSPELAREMFEAYSRYRVLHEVLVLLELAIRNALPADQVSLRERFRWIDALCDSGAALGHGR